MNLKVHIEAMGSIPRWGCVNSYGLEADSGDAISENHIVGVTEGKMEPGSWGDAVILGMIFDPDWAWTPGAALYLNGTALSETAPVVGFVQQIGLALTKQSVYVHVEPTGSAPVVPDPVPRITEEGDTRMTEEGDTRYLET